MATIFSVLVPTHRSTGASLVVPGRQGFAQLNDFRHLDSVRG